MSALDYYNAVKDINDMMYENSVRLLEKVCIDVVEGGRMTKDLALLIHRNDMTSEHWLTTEEFLEAIDSELKARMA